MSFIVLTSAKVFDMIIDAGEMPHLLALGTEIVLVRLLLDELARDASCGQWIRDHSPPFVIVDTEPPNSLAPYPVVDAAVVEYLTGTGRERMIAGEAGVLVMHGKGAWFASQRFRNLAMLVADEGLVDGIRQHFAGQGDRS